MSNKLRQRISIPSGTLIHHRTGIRILLESIDITIIFLCLLLAASIEPSGLDWFSLKGFLQENALFLVVAGLVFLISADLTKLYRSWRWHSIWAEILTLCKSWFLVSLILLLIVLSEDTSGPSSRMLHWLLIVPLALGTWRMILRFVARKLRAIGFNKRKALIIGSNTDSVNLARELVSRKDEIGIRFLGFFDSTPPDEKIKKDILELGLIRELAVAVEMAAKNEVDIIYLTLSLNREPEIRNLIHQLSDTTVSVHLLIPELFEPILYNQTQQFRQFKTVSIYGTPFEDRLNEKIKRFEDLLLSSIFILIAIIPMLLIAVAIRTTSGTPVIFKQKRYGLGGKPVIIWKFRTMVVCQDGGGFSQAKKNDPRVTPLGAFLRKTSLDELPQLINVFQGQMSLVGPRPHPVSLNEEYRGSIKSYMHRHSVKPGITGWAQVNGWRGETNTLRKMEKRVEFDLFYIRNWSLLLDMKILFMTLYRGFIGKNAY